MDGDDVDRAAVGSDKKEWRHRESGGIESTAGYPTRGAAGYLEFLRTKGLSDIGLRRGKQLQLLRCSERLSVGEP